MLAHISVIHCIYYESVMVQVEPLLEVLVGKCLEQGLMEVMEEEELAAMRAHQQHYEQVCPVPLNLSLIMARQAIRTLHCCGLASGTCKQLFTADCPS